MVYYINMENGSGMKFKSKEDFLKEMNLMIDDCIANGGDWFSVEVNANAECFLVESEDK